MNILTITGAFYPKGGGSVTAVTSLAQGLAQRGHNVTFLTRGYNRADCSSEWNGMMVFRVHQRGFSLPFRLMLVLGQVRKGLRLIKANRFDVIHAHGFTSLFVGEILCFFRRTPVVVTFHGLQRLWEVDWDVRHFLRYSFMLPFEGVLARRADLVIAQSAKLKSVLTQIYSVREASISVIPNSVDTSTFRFHPAVQRSKVVLFVGSLGWAYGPDILVNAAKHVLARVPDAEFTFVGAGPGKQSIIDLARSLGIEQHVHLVGLITGRKQLESYYASSRMLVMPQRIRGGYILSLAALESMAVGRPVLIGYEIDDTPGVISVKSDPVALAQQITDILMLDDESYSDLCRAARFSIEEFDTAAISERLEASYRSLIESRP